MKVVLREGILSPPKKKVLKTREKKRRLGEPARKKVQNTKGPCRSLKKIKNKKPWAEGPLMKDAVGKKTV